MEQGRMTRGRSALACTGVATVSFALALALARVGLPEYSHWVHPVGLRGAVGLPGAWLFDAAAFVLPALCLVLASLWLRTAWADAGWAVRIGLALAQLSALAFGAQGLLPMDPSDMDSHATRLHVLAWMLWWIGFVPAALLLAVGARRDRMFAACSLLAGLLLPSIAVLAPVGGWAGVAQRLAFGLWFGWWLLAAWRLGRGAR